MNNDFLGDPTKNFSAWSHGISMTRREAKILLRQKTSDMSSRAKKIYRTLLTEHLAKVDVGRLPQVVTYRELAERKAEMDAAISQIELAIEQGELDRKKAVGDPGLKGEQRANAIATADATIDDAEARLEKTKAGIESMLKDLHAAEDAAREAAESRELDVAESVSAAIKQRIEQTLAKLEEVTTPLLIELSSLEIAHEDAINRTGIGSELKAGIGLGNKWK